MPRYVAFLGSINVGGNRLAMADLRAALEREDFEGVETVVASGNVLLSHDGGSTDGLSEKLAYILADRFDIDTFAAIRSADEVRAAIVGNPFHGTGVDTNVHTHFLAGRPQADAFARLIADQKERGPERLAAGDRALYIDFVDGVGQSKLSGAFIERRLGCRGTARNMRSLTRILAKMEGAA